MTYIHKNFVIGLVTHQCPGESGSLWFKHILFRRKGLGAAYNATMPSPEEVFTIVKADLQSGSL